MLLDSGMRHVSWVVAWSMLAVGCSVRNPAFDEVRGGSQGETLSGDEETTVPEEAEGDGGTGQETETGDLDTGPFEGTEEEETDEGPAEEEGETCMGGSLSIDEWTFVRSDTGAFGCQPFDGEYQPYPCEELTFHTDNPHPVYGVLDMGGGVWRSDEVAAHLLMRFENADGLFAMDWQVEFAELRIQLDADPSPNDRVSVHLFKDPDPWPWSDAGGYAQLAQGGQTSFKWLNAVDQAWPDSDPLDATQARMGSQTTDEMDDNSVLSISLSPTIVKAWLAQPNSQTNGLLLTASAAFGAVSAVPDSVELLYEVCP